MTPQEIFEERCEEVERHCNFIRLEAMALLKMADRRDLLVTITTEPIPGEPLAMGVYQLRVQVRPRREVYQALMALEEAVK